jgi:hypothetical protein
MVQDVGESEIVPEGGDDQGKRCRSCGYKNGDSGAAGCLTQSLVFANDGNDPGNKSVNAQRQRQ